MRKGYSWQKILLRGSAVYTVGLGLFVLAGPLLFSLDSVDAASSTRESLGRGIFYAGILGLFLNTYLLVGAKGRNAKVTSLFLGIICAVIIFVGYFIQWWEI